MASSKRDYYEVLGVAKDADDAAIKRAFKRLAIKYHPDHNKEADAEEKFREINEAYQVLSDPQKRQAYDQFGFEGVNAQGQGGNPFSSQDFTDIFGDIFGEMFGGGRSSGRAAQADTRGADLRIQVSLTLEEAVKGVKKKINIKTKAPCEHCHGQGSNNPSKRKTCPACHGTGVITQASGFLAMRRPCPHCGGLGQFFSEPCSHCHGEGRMDKAKTLSIDIPAGVDTGDRIRLQGEGQAGVRGGRAGDLYVVIEVKPHQIFTREGNDLICEVPISFTTAALGGQVGIPTLDGRVNITIRKETQTGTVMRLSGKGVKSLHSMGKGDLFCRIVVETPVNLTDYQKELLQKFEASLNGEEEPDAKSKGKGKDNDAKHKASHKPKSESFFESVKNFIDDLKS